MIREEEFRSRQRVRQKEKSEFESLVLNLLNKGFPLSWSIFMTRLRFSPYKDMTVVHKPEDFIPKYFGRRKVKKIYPIDQVPEHVPLDLNSSKPYHYIAETKKGNYAVRLNGRGTRVLKTKIIKNSLESRL